MERPYKGLVITMWFINLKSALITPIIFKVNLNAVGFEQWLAQHLLLSLKIPSVLIIDKSLIHRKNVIRELVEAEVY